MSYTSLGSLFGRKLFPASARRAIQRVVPSKFAPAPLRRIVVGRTSKSQQAPASTEDAPTIAPEPIQPSPWWVNVIQPYHVTPGPYQPTPTPIPWSAQGAPAPIPWSTQPIKRWATKATQPQGVEGLAGPTTPQLAKFLENYKGYVLAFSPTTNVIAAYPAGMSKIAFTIKLDKNEPTDLGLSRARARIDGPGSLNGMGAFDPNTAWGNRYRASPWQSWRSGNGRRQQVPFYAMNGLGSVPPVVLDPPIDQQEIRWDAPSLTLYIGSNKVALIPALISALAVKVILLGGSKVATAGKFWGASDKAARKIAKD